MVRTRQLLKSVVAAVLLLLSPAIVEMTYTMAAVGMQESILYGDGALVEDGKSQENNDEEGGSGLPSYYSSVDEGWVTPVKNQGGYGTCWSFATIACAETYMLKNKGALMEDMDLSEFHLVYFTYHPVADALGGTVGDGVFHDSNGSSSYPGIGGNYYISMSTLANWKGVVKEELAPYEDKEEPDMGLAREYDVAHLENAQMLPLDDRETVKKYIMEYGAGGINYNSYSPYYVNDKSNYYYPIETTNKRLGEGHSVVIVGWDDSYCASLFKNEPPGDGAWLIKNSWGSASGDNGYMWLSYYDSSVENSVTFFDFGESDNYQYEYQYDGTISSTLVYYTDDTNEKKTTAANAFVAKSNQTVKAVSFYTYSDDIEYSIQIYKGLSSTSAPDGGTPAYGKVISGVEKYRGYHTIKLDNEIVVKEGERFSVVVTLKGDAKFPVEHGEYSNAGRYESYVYEEGTDIWYDVKDYDGLYTSNVRIKAFLCDYEGGKDELDEDGPDEIQNLVKPIKVNVERYPYIINKGQKLTDSMFDINVTYSDSTVKKVLLSDCEVLGFNSSVASKQSVTIRYSDSQGSVSDGSIVIHTISIGKPSVSCTAYNKIKISFGTVGGCGTYDIYRTRVSDGKCVKVATVSSSSYTDTCTSGVYYRYHVTPSSSLGDGAKKIYAKSSQSAKIRGIVQKPTVKSVTSVNYNTNRITWTKTSGASGYYLYRKQQGKKYVLIADITGKSTVSYSDSKAVTGIKYAYAVKAYRTVSKEKIFGKISNAKSVRTELSKVVLRSSQVNGRRITLRWRKVAGATGYQVYVSTSPVGKYKKSADVKTLYYACKTPEKGKYYYKIRAYRTVACKRYYSGWTII